MVEVTISSIPKEILDIANSIIEDTIKKMESGKNREEVQKLRNKIDKSYNALCKELNRYIGNLNSLNVIDLESMVGASGVAEAIACCITFKATQLRKLFYQVKLIHQDIKKEGDVGRLKVSIAKLIPHLAYAKGRDLIDENFYQLTKNMLLKVETSEDFRIFVDIFEAIVAYHRYYNPKEQ